MGFKPLWSLHRPGKGCHGSAQQAAVFHLVQVGGDGMGGKEGIQFPGKCRAEAGELVELRAFDDDAAAFSSLTAAQYRPGS